MIYLNINWWLAKKDIDYNKETIFIQNYLYQDEDVLWKEKSKKDNFLVKIGKIIFILVWHVFCFFFFESMIIMAEPLLAFVVFKILFVSIGYYLYMLDFLKEHW